MQLKWSDANAKTENLLNCSALWEYLALRPKVKSFDLLSGWSCPSAVECLSKVIKTPEGKSKIQDGPKTQFRCFSASQEALFPVVFNARKWNFERMKQAKTVDNMYKLLSDSLPKKMGVCRIHVGGDFFNQEYFDAWLKLADNNPSRLFYAYTKSLPFWLRRLGQIPFNFVLTASFGGRHDSLIKSEGLRYAKVVLSESEAESLGLEIDHDDSHAANPQTPDKSFALLIHGVQPKGSKAAKALKALKGKGSYSRGNV